MNPSEDKQSEERARRKAALRTTSIAAVGQKYFGTLWQQADMNDWQLLAMALDSKASASSSCAATVPTGWKLVPVTPTAEMLNAASKAETRHTVEDRRRGGHDPDVGHGTIYRAMVDAARAPVPESASSGALPKELIASAESVILNDNLARQGRGGIPAEGMSLLLAQGICRAAGSPIRTGQSAVPESADITPDLAKAYVAERDALLVWKDRALKAEAARCPLGLDDTPTICSAATCASCKAWREYIARSASAAREDGQLSREEKFTMVHNLMNRVDSLLVEAGFKQESSIRHQLKIAKSILRDAE